MNRYQSLFWAVCLGGLLHTALWGASLAPYLIHSTDLPADCQSIPGFFPTDPKLDHFYDNKTYRSALPPMSDRHAQSFQCGQEKGTLYFFLYQKPSEAETSELFSRGIFSHLSPAPEIKNFPNGFVVLSFKETPPALVETLDRKLKGRETTQAKPAIPVSPMAVSLRPAVALSTPSPVATLAPVPKPIALPVPQPVTIPKATTALLEADLSQDVPDALIKELDCQGTSLSEGREACELVAAFNKGKEIDPSIPLQSARVGLAYTVSSFGQLNGRFYLALIGSGRPGEMALVPLPSDTGVDDMETQALITARQQNQPLPASNEKTVRLQKHQRPGKMTLFPTKGNSWALHLSGNKTGYLRRAGERWILIVVFTDNPALQTRSDIIIASLY